MENAFFRYKSDRPATVFGHAVHRGQRREAVLACHVLNRMTELGRPVSYRIGRGRARRCEARRPARIPRTTAAVCGGVDGFGGARLVRGVGTRRVRSRRPLSISRLPTASAQTTGSRRNISRSGRVGPANNSARHPRRGPARACVPAASARPVATWATIAGRVVSVARA